MKRLWSIGFVMAVAGFALGTVAALDGEAWHALACGVIGGMMFSQWLYGFVIDSYRTIIAGYRGLLEDVNRDFRLAIKIIKDRE